MLVTSRDFVMARSVRRNADGSILSNHVSVVHPGTGDQKGYVRGEVDVSGYFIEPISDSSCKCTYVVQLDPKGVCRHEILNANANPFCSGFPLLSATPWRSSSLWCWLSSRLTWISEQEGCKV